MSRNMQFVVGVIGAVGMGFATGCSMPKMTVEQIKAMKPDRAPELDQLDMFVGTWTSDSEMNFTFLDKPIKGTGTSTVAWECDKTVLLNRGEWEMGELGRMSGLEGWRWDDKAGEYRLHWIDSWGHTGHGTATYDAATRTWCLKASGTDFEGHKTVGEGTVTFRDANTMEWTWSEWTWGKLSKIGDMKGTGRRK